MTRQSDERLYLPGSSAHSAHPCAIPAALLALVAGLAHVPVTPEHLDEAPYIGVLFIVLTVACVIGAAWLLISDSRAVWASLGATCLLAVAGYVVSRTVGLPMMADDVGNWFETLGVVSVVTEAAVACWPPSRWSAATVPPRPPELPQSGGRRTGVHHEGTGPLAGRRVRDNLVMSVSIRRAVPDDAASLVHLRALMFEAMSEPTRETDAWRRSFVAVGRANSWPPTRWRRSSPPTPPRVSSRPLSARSTVTRRRRTTPSV